MTTHKFILLLLIGTLAACTNELSTPTPTPTSAPTATPQPTETPEPEYVLVWQDEFDGDTIDSSKWNLEVHGRPANNELQYYSDFPENAFIEDGNLVIQAIKLEERYIGRDYMSARMNTVAKASFTYGRFEMRAKLPEGQGIWPAFWMLPTQAKYGGWPSGGEIDIMELLGHEPNKVHGSLHWKNEDGHEFTTADYVLPEGTFSSDFHTFAVEWEEDEIRWYVDDILFKSDTKWEHRLHPFPAPFDQEFYLILNVAVGGNWPGAPDETTVFPQQMVVDYVCVYEKR